MTENKDDEDEEDINVQPTFIIVFITLANCQKCFSVKTICSLKRKESCDMLV